MDCDVLIHGGLVVDGTGAPAALQDVAIRGEQIVAVGHLEEANAELVLDAKGLIVAPGFIDVHVHSEFARLRGEDRLAGIRQGVTTELMSPDGFSWTPLPRPQLEGVREYLKVFYGDLPRDWNWTTVEEYLSIFRGNLPGNLVPQAAYLPIRVGVMGWDTRPASPRELAAMQRATAEWMTAGAVALATGLEYQPGAFASTDELVVLSRVAAAAGGIYVAHQRGYWSRLEGGSAETFRIGREVGIPTHISHLAVDERAEALLGQAQAEGADVSFDMYPYTAACTHLMMMLPEWAQIGGQGPTLARLRESHQRVRLREETASRLAERGEITLSFVEGEEDLEGRILGELAEEASLADVDYLFDLLLRHEGRVLAIYHWPETVNDGEVLERTLKHPLYVGGSDGIFRGRRPHRRGFGTFPRIVGDYVRNGTLRLEQAIHKVTGRPAARFRIRDRGFLKRGFAADVVIFDPLTIADRTTWQDSRQMPTGILHVLVNGEVVLTDARPTGNLPGRVLR